MKLCLVVVGLVVVRSTIGVPSLSWHSRPEFDVRCMKTSQPTGENQPTRCLDSRRVKKSLLKKITGKRKRRRVAQTARSPVATRARVTRESTGMEPSLGHDRGGSLQWLPARVMSDLPRWHTQRYGRCQNSRYLFGQRRGVPLSRTTCSASRPPSSIPRHRPPFPRY